MLQLGVVTAAEPASWVREGDAYTCRRHHVTFGLVEDCPQCRTDPGDDRDLDPPVKAAKAPKGCATSLQIEQRLEARAATVGALIDAAKKRKAAPSTLAALADSWAKLVRIQLQLATRREDEMVVRDRERRLRAMRKGSGH